MRNNYLPPIHRKNIEYDSLIILRKIEHVIKSSKLSDLELISLKSVLDSASRRYAYKIKDLVA